jgi:hypothetical protein
MRVGVALVLAMAAVAGQWMFWDGGLLEVEATAFIPQYLADRSLPAKLFDPHLNDFDAYQARELSYVIDFADAHVHAWIARLAGVSDFVPASAAIATLAIAIVVTAGVAGTMPNVGGVATTIVLAIFFSSFQYASTAGIYYRSSKIALAVILLALLFRLRVLALDQDGRGAGSIALLSAAAGLLDRQGFFYIVVVSACVMLHWWMTGRLAAVARALAITIAVLIAYNLVMAPLLVHALNGYWPDFEYQSRSLRSVVLLWHPSYFARAAALLAENAVVMMGGALITLAAGAVILFASAPSLRAKALPRAAIYFGAGLIAQVVMFAMMIHQHPPIADYVDHRLWYYTVPFCVTVMFALLCWLNAILPMMAPRQRALVLAALLACVAGNLAGLPSHRQTMAGGPYFNRVFAQSELLRRSVETGTPNSALDEVYREFYDDEMRLFRR